MIKLLDTNRGGDPDSPTLDQMQAAWSRADAQSDYDRLWQPHYGFASEYNPIAP